MKMVINFICFVVAGGLFWYAVIMWIINGIDKTMMLRGF